jgi:Na+-translocating ferredoxin:NAD+ oxidoreductase RNF subunit RnfB
MTETYYHSVRFDAALCDGCLACVRVCPTRAVRVRHGTAVMLEDRCVDCGECLKAHDGRTSRVSLADHPGMDRSYFDVAVSIADLFLHLVGAIAELPRGSLPAETESAAGLNWALSTGLAPLSPAEDTLAVAGLPNVLRILDDIEKGKLRRYAFVECHACPEGCVSGVLTVEDPYVARARAVRLMRSLPVRSAVDRDRVRREYDQGGFRMPHRVLPRPMRPLHDDVAVAIGRMVERDRLMASLPRLDCGTCGAPACDAFAEDVVRGETSEEACVFLREGRIEAKVRELASLVRRQAQGERS